jgi:hypothetical protein
MKVNLPTSFVPKIPQNYVFVQHEQVWNRNYVWLLHSYEIHVLGCKIIL